MARIGSAFAGITVVMFLGAVGCSSHEEPPDDRQPVTGTADLKAVAERWRDLSPEERHEVCERATKSERPDYRGMLHVLEDAGLRQQDAAAMLPYAVNECV
ncbi:hypothetical protein ACFW2V_13165 [Streptomyces sp. NPDC058947]|uniref:hypothetical protein n=1 Tax=Streptomyces sp. NPDC058947 TaxID=3346675 RepID=UPI0036B595A8